MKYQISSKLRTALRDTLQRAILSGTTPPQLWILRYGADRDGVIRGEMGVRVCLLSAA
jgi:hypothetical protein